MAALCFGMSGSLDTTPSACLLAGQLPALREKALLLALCARTLCRAVKSMKEMDQSLPDRSVALPTTHTAVEPLDISFGVEFEFILVEHFPDWDEWINKKLEGNVLFGLSRIGNVLRNTLFKCGSCSEQFHMPVGVQDASTSWRSDHSQWNVVADETMSLSPRQKTNLGEGHFDTIAFEVTSRKLFTDRGIPVTIPAGSTTTTHQHTIAPEEEIKTALDSLHRAFMSPAAAATDGRIKQWLVTNRTCGLHIHVGNDERGFPLQTVKNAMSLHTAFERVIDSMQSKPRIGGTALALAALDALDHEQVDGVRRDDEFRSMPIPLTPDDVPNVPLTEFHIARAWCQRRNTGRPAPPASTPATPVAPTFPSSHTASNARLAQAVFGLHTAAFLEVIQATPNINALAQSFRLPENNVLRLLRQIFRSHSRPARIEMCYVSSHLPNRKHHGRSGRPDNASRSSTSFSRTSSHTDPRERSLERPHAVRSQLPAKQEQFVLHACNEEAGKDNDPLNPPLPANVAENLEVARAQPQRIPLSGFSISAAVRVMLTYRRLGNTGFQGMSSALESLRRLRRSCKTCRISSIDESIEPWALGVWAAMTRRRGVRGKSHHTLF
jgi:hypothetical protein